MGRRKTKSSAAATAEVASQDAHMTDSVKKDAEAVFKIDKELISAANPDEDDKVTSAEPEEEEGTAEATADGAQPAKKLRKKNDDESVGDAKKGTTPEKGEAGTEEAAAEEKEATEEAAEEEEGQEEEEEDEDEEGAAADPAKQAKRAARVDHNAPKKMMTDKEAETGIAEFMEKQNRPYSV